MQTTGKRTARILVVDDEPELRELLVDALSDTGHDIRTAADGKEAIRLAQDIRPDLLVTDLCLGDSYGVDLIEQIRRRLGEVPAVVITGRNDGRTFADASRTRPIEMMTKPLDLVRLRETIEAEIRRQDRLAIQSRRSRRLLEIARRHRDRSREVQEQIQTTCMDLTEAYRSLSGQLAGQQIVLHYQRDLLGSRTDDDVFRSLFRLFVKRSGPVFGVALVCDESAELQVVGRFGVPYPDPARFCQSLARPVIDKVLQNPRCQVFEAGEEAELYDPEIQEFLVGLNVLAVPLLPAPGEMIGLVVFYRKGEQPFTQEDVQLAESIFHPTAVAVRRND
jgi:DNA-binding response OmpR family regulator